MISRREFIGRAILAGVLSAQATRRALAGAGTTTARRRRPRYYCIGFLGGGFDQIFTTNPKTRREVESFVDVPYAPNAIIDTGRYPLGPHLASLRSVADRISILKGVELRVANHQSGMTQMVRLRTSVTREMPGLLDIIGQTRQGPALSCLSIGRMNPLLYDPNDFFGARDLGGTKILLQQIDELSNDDLLILSETLTRQAQAFARHTSHDRYSVAAANATSCATFFQRLTTVPRFAPQVWSEGKEAQEYAVLLQRILWAFEHDLTSGVFCAFGLNWDTHSSNNLAQTEHNEAFFPMLARFTSELHTRKNAFGVLAENTVVVTGSELGRYPQLNGVGGKDHFPEGSFLFVGGPFQKGHGFGATGRAMQGLPVSLKTGNENRSGSMLVLDDIGTTLLHLAGINPTAHGYTGRVLDFLVEV